ncbi:MAG: DAK2 domain-containing protein, partial [Saccharomonospora viridis]|jgi:dihydroxyacetone kinase
MELGLGIHGEPGIRTVPRLDAVGVADELVNGLLPELPTGGDGRVVVLLNGLGTTKYEDMFVLYKRVHERLAAEGLNPLHTEVGEFVTSLDMAGVSLTVLALDDDLAPLYAAPCETPAYRSSGATWEQVPPSSTVDESLERPDDTQVAGVVDRLLTAGMVRLEQNEDELGRLDAVAADGDHGLGMTRGIRAAVAAARRAESDGESISGALLAAGTAFADAAGGASGALYGVLLAETGAGLAQAGGITAASLAEAVDRATAAFVELGGAQPGDKTMLDALEPFRVTLRAEADAGADLVRAWNTAAERATRAAADTADLTPTKGRAARLAQRSQGYADPGATSFALLVSAIGDELKKEN